MRKGTQFALAALLLTPLVGCSDNPTEPETTADHYVFQPGVEAVDVVDMMDDNTMHFDALNRELWIKRTYVDNPETAPFEVGDVVYCVPTEQITWPLFLRVTAMTKVKRGVSYYLVSSEQADLIDVFQEARIHRSIPLNLAEENYELPDDTISLIDSGSFSVTQLELENSKFSATCTGSNSSDITINRGVVELIDPVMVLDIEIVDSQLKEFKAVVDCRSKVDFDMSLDFRFSRACEWYKEIFKMEKDVVTMAGPLPILTTYRFGIEVGFGVDGAVTASVTLDDYVADAIVAAGVEYNNPGDTPCEPESDCYDYIQSYKITDYTADSEPLIEAEVKVSFEAFIREEISVTLYKLVGPEFWMKQYVGPRITWPAPASAECSFTQAHVELIAGHKMGGRLNCGFMDKAFASWEFYESDPIEKTLWDDCLP